MIIKNITQNTIVASKVCLADSFIIRLKGLLGTDKLESGAAFIIRPCNSIHTFGMRYTIDVVFLNKQNKIIKITKAMVANRFSLCLNSSYVVELPFGTIDATGTKVGDTISLIL